MSSPAKKRKRNDYKAADQPARGLDYFFAKQKEKKQEQEADGVEKEPKAADEEEGYGLTDEELARKLQAQWDAEDQQVQSSRSKGRDESGRDDAPQVVENPQGEEASKREEEAINSSTTTEIATDRSKNTLALQSTATDEDTITTNIPFDESPLTFEPSKYIPDLQKHWASDGGNASYALLTRCFVLVNSTQSRIKIVDTLVNLLRTIIEADSDSLLPAVRLQTC